MCCISSDSSFVDAVIVSAALMGLPNVDWTLRRNGQNLYCVCLHTKEYMKKELGFFNDRMKMQKNENQFASLMILLSNIININHSFIRNFVRYFLTYFSFKAYVDKWNSLI